MDWPSLTAVRRAALDELPQNQNQSQVLLWLSGADSESYQLAMERCPPSLAVKVYGQMLGLASAAWGWLMAPSTACLLNTKTLWFHHAVVWPFFRDAYIYFPVHEMT